MESIQNRLTWSRCQKYNLLICYAHILKKRKKKIVLNTFMWILNWMNFFLNDSFNLIQIIIKILIFYRTSLFACVVIRQVKILFYMGDKEIKYCVGGVNWEKSHKTRQVSPPHTTINFLWGVSNIWDLMILIYFKSLEVSS